MVHGLLTTGVYTRRMSDVPPPVSGSRPPSAVSSGVGIAGLVGLGAWLVIAKQFGMDGPYAALVALIWTAVPMVVWSLAVDKVHRRASTGIDWAAPVIMFFT